MTDAMWRRACMHVHRAAWGRPAAASQQRLLLLLLDHALQAACTHGFPLSCLVQHPRPSRGVNRPSHDGTHVSVTGVRWGPTAFVGRFRHLLGPGFKPALRNGGSAVRKVGRRCFAQFEGHCQSVAQGMHGCKARTVTHAGLPQARCRAPFRRVGMRAGCSQQQHRGTPDGLHLPRFVVQGAVTRRSPRRQSMQAITGQGLPGFLVERVLHNAKINSSKSVRL